MLFRSPRTAFLTAKRPSSATRATQPGPRRGPSSAVEPRPSLTSRASGAVRRWRGGRRGHGGGMAGAAPVGGRGGARGHGAGARRGHGAGARRFSQNRLHRLVRNDFRLREPTRRDLTGDPRSGCGRIRHGTAESDTVGPDRMANSPWTRFWEERGPTWPWAEAAVTRQRSRARGLASKGPGARADLRRSAPICAGEGQAGAGEGQAGAGQGRGHGTGQGRGHGTTNG